MPLNSCARCAHLSVRAYKVVWVLAQEPMRLEAERTHRAIQCMLPDRFLFAWPQSQDRMVTRRRGPGNLSPTAPTQASRCCFSRAAQARGVSPRRRRCRRASCIRAGCAMRCAPCCCCSKQ
eukprot:6203132-Pleurochrysis_carterae.AAC.3